MYRVSVALEIPLRELTEVRADMPAAVPSAARPRRAPETSSGSSQ